jgi:probable F420-dependent oxidoreductase
MVGPMSEDAAAAELEFDLQYELTDNRTSAAIECAVAAERRGFDGLWTHEVSHDPFLPLSLAAAHTEHLTLGTAIAVAFARSPMTLAQTAHDLHRFSSGRFVLGLGSQIRAHIERRFSMPWSRPAARMRELVLAVRAIWDCWETQAPLQFEGDFYRHTLMAPTFDPGPTGYGVPRILLAAVNELMTEVAGEVADGIIAHSFTTEPYLREVTLPALERGLAAAGRGRADVEIKVGGFVVTGSDEHELSDRIFAARKQIAFYGSTPAYRPVLEHHGWGPLQDELHSLSRQGRWDDMTLLVDDDVLSAFAVVAPLAEVAAALQARWGGIADRVSVTDPRIELA